jgi:hypothetical protein
MAEEGMREHRLIRRILREAITEALGSSPHKIILFHLERLFGEDPYDVLAEDPRAFYIGLQRILGPGADVVLSFVGAYLRKRYHVEFPVGEFLTVFTTGEEKQKLRLFEAISKCVPS